ncbi:disease resistance protein RUN1-like isoform X1 [Rosa rugosa]|uniref:disease resistance protein RUN1-like isoform X1 n=1 Tax=Rosa rugosa TaxID=74645 RepID=UPI002B416831|nr:disease resistance protein RUN1-like isoform X1 [Rosa rugosa]
MALMTTRNTSSSSSFPSLSSNPQWSEWTYDVFLSFRGEDTRKGFTDHLYVALEREGIFTFRDDEELERGKPISAKLLQAIQESRIAVVVFSRNYASSRWCLDELVKIVECMKEIGQTVLPVFYDVDPSEVRNQTEAFGKAFADHEKRFKNNLEKVERWRAALTEVANLSGFPLQNRYESEFIQGIVMKIRSDLDGTLSIVSKDLVGIGLRVEEMMELCLGIEENDVGFIGIWGMGGIGKTTLARAFYEKVHNQFQASSYLNNVREVSTKSDGLVSLQKKLLFDVQMKSITSKGDVHMGISKIQRRLCHKKVLIILDDVDKLEQLQALAGSKNWFGRGSRIIITTRDEQLLIAHGVEKRYKARELKNDEALELFSWKAFKDNHPPKDYMEVSQDFVNYAKGLPLAIEVVGPFLSGKSIIEWKSSLSRLKGNLDKEIMRVLLMGFDGLHEKEQQIFLDIACFFKGEDRDRVTKILESFGFDPISSIGVLIRKSLITVIGRTLWMHDLLQGMGWEIVRQECTKEPGKRSRLWHYDDVLDVMQYDKGTDAVEGIVLNVSPEEKVQLNDEAFSMMKKLRFLKISNVLLPHGLKYLSTELQYIEWHGYPSKLLPQNFPSSKLAELNMYCSQITHLWKGIKVLNKLKSIDLSDSESLIETPNFTGVPNLEILIFTGCKKLSKVHPSIVTLRRLTLLNMKNCKSLKSISHNISLESLETLILSGCAQLKRFPDIVGDMECLSKLYLDGTAITELPLSINCLAGLTVLDLSDCKNLLRLPNAICSLTWLKKFTLSGCSKLRNIPDSLVGLESLEELDVSRTAITQMPLFIVYLKNLKVLSYSGCTSLSKSVILPAVRVGTSFDQLGVLAFPYKTGKYP